jgi:RNA polymerase sigma-70 factor, ECF subfamily
MIASATTTETEMDREWFAGEVQDLLPDLYGTALRLCRERADAEDLVAETIAKAWAALPSLQQRSAFRGWLFRILSNTYVSVCRAARARPVHEALDATGDFSLFERLHQPILLWWGNPELDFLNALLREDLARAIDDLPEAYRTAVVMVDVQGLAYREVAELLDVPVGTVRSRLARGRALLQRALWEHALDKGLAQGPAPRDDELEDA